MLTIENLAKTFVIHILDRKRIEAFHEVPFCVKKGQFVGISGHSGSGKSSVLKCIYRTYLPTSGAIRYRSRDGEADLARLPEQEVIALRIQEIGYVSQFLRVIPRVPALDVVAEPLYALGTSRQEGREKARHLLTRLNIPDRLHDAYPNTFSGGEQQRINIARAVIWKPSLLLLDEPTASLDKDSEVRVIEILRELKREGTSMVGIFHDPATMALIADEVFHLETE